MIRSLKVCQRSLFLSFCLLWYEFPNTTIKGSRVEGQKAEQSSVTRALNSSLLKKGLKIGLSLLELWNSCQVESKVNSFWIVLANSDARSLHNSHCPTRLLPNFRF